MSLSHHDFLTRLGLSEHESVVYLALLEEGPGGVADIARRTGLFRPTIYQALAGLSSQELVGTAPKGKYRQYVAESPRALERSFAELSRQFDAQVAALSEKEAKHAECTRPTVRYLEGEKSLRAVYDDVVTTLSKNSVYYRYSSARVGTERNNRNLISKTYRLLRDQKGIQRMVITNEPNKARKRPRLEREVKTVPQKFDLFDYNITEIIYGDKVAFMDFDTDTAIVVEHRRFATFQEKIFKLLWSKL